MKILLVNPIANKLFIFKGVLDYIEHLSKKGIGLYQIEKIPITKARNESFKVAKENDFDYILFLDDDNPPNDFDVLEKMIALKKDIVTGFIRRKHGIHLNENKKIVFHVKKLINKPPQERKPILDKIPDEYKIDIGEYFNPNIQRNTFCVYDKKDYGDKFQYFPLYEMKSGPVDMCGAGFVLISKRVFEWALSKYPMPFERKSTLYNKVGWTWYEAIYDKIDEGDILSTKLIPCDSDVLFFERCKSAGFEIYAHKDIHCDHFSVENGDVYQVRAKQNDTIIHKNAIFEYLPKLKNYCDDLLKNN